MNFCDKLIVKVRPRPSISSGERMNVILEQIFFVIIEVKHFHSNHLFLVCHFLSLLLSDFNDKTLDRLCNAVLFDDDSFVLSCSELQTILMLIPFLSDRAKRCIMSILTG